MLRKKKKKGGEEEEEEEDGGDDDDYDKDEADLVNVTVDLEVNILIIVCIIPVE